MNGVHSTPQTGSMLNIDLMTGKTTFIVTTMSPTSVPNYKYSVFTLGIIDIHEDWWVLSLRRPFRLTSRCLHRLVFTDNLRGFENGNMK